MSDNSFDLDLFDQPKAVAKRCRTCGVEKLSDAFYQETAPYKFGGLRFKPDCKVCISDAHARGLRLTKQPGNPIESKICRGCGLDKPIAQFRVTRINKRIAPVYNHKCMDCCTRKRASKTVIYGAPAPKVCRSCNLELPRAAFWPRANERCRSCCKLSVVIPIKLLTKSLTCRTCKKTRPKSDFSINRMTKCGNPLYNHTCEECRAVPMNTKVCSGCNVEKPLDGFHSIKGYLKDDKIFYRQPCRDCCRDFTDKAKANASGYKNCWTCGEIQPTDEFPVVHINKDGTPYRNVNCRLCLNKKKSPNKVIYVTPETKFCKTCDTTKPVSEFRVKRVRLDGETSFNNQCHLCARSANRRRGQSASAKARAIRLANPKLKICTECMVGKSPNEFVVKSTNSNGRIKRGGVCIQCHQATMDSRRAAREAIRNSATRKCKECGETKPIDRFVKHGAGYRYKCTDCHNVVQRVYGRDWTAKNPKGQRAKERRRRAAKRGAEGSHAIQDIERIRNAQKDRCCMPWCRVKLKGGGTVEHRVPLARGGTDNADNLQLACKPCNSSKNARDEIEFVQSRNAVVRVGQLHLL